MAVPTRTPAHARAGWFRGPGDRQLPEHTRSGTGTKTRTGETLDEMARQEEALASYDEAIEVLRGLSEREAGRPDLLPNGLLNKGLALEHLGRTTEALHAYNQAISLFRTLIADGRTDLRGLLAISLNNKGSLRQTQVHLASALEALDEAIRLLRDLVVEGRTGLRLELAKGLSNRGGALVQAGRIEEALAAHKEAIELRRDLIAEGDIHLRDDQALALNGYSAVLTEAGQRREALSAIDEAIELERSLIAAGRVELRSQLAKFLANRGSALSNLNRSDEAIPPVDEAVELVECLIGESQGDAPVELLRGLAEVLHIRAMVLEDLGQTEDALTTFEQSIAFCQALGNLATTTHLLAIKGLAQLHADHRRFELASDLLYDAFDLIEDEGRVPAGFADRLAFRDTVAHIYELAMMLAVIQNAVGAAFAYGQFAKGRTLTDLLERAIVVSPMIPGGEPDEIRVQEVLLFTKDLEIDSMSRGNGQDEAHTANQDQILDSFDPGEAPPWRENLAELAIREPRSGSELVEMLRPGEALLDFHALGAFGFVAHLLLPEHGIVWAGHLRRTPILDALQAWSAERSAVAKTGKANDPYGFALGSEDGGLYELLFSYVAPHLNEHQVQHLIISPSRNLHDVPWVALWHEDQMGNRRWLSDEYVLSTTPTPSSLWHLRQKGAALVPGIRCLAVAPYAGEEPFPSVEELYTASGTTRRIIRDNNTELLPGTGTETEAVAALVKNCGGEPVVLRGTQANRATIVQQIGQQHLVLLATHGRDVPGGDDPSRVGLSFADETVRTFEIFNGALPMRDALQVALTGCNLARVAERGDGIVGFMHAFLFAGARTVLAPIWAVDDASTAMLSITHHEALLRTDRPSVAEAWQRAMSVARSQPDWQHPFFWAAFLPCGDGAVRLPA